MMKLKSLLIMSLLSCIVVVSLGAQEFPNTDEEFKELYQKNIKKSRINGVYIPKDLDDAFNELNSLSTIEARNKYKSGDEDLVVSRLSRGIGQWMIVNWNFYEGSRMSHYIKGIGVTHPEDMAEFMMRVYHRHLLGKELDYQNLALQIDNKRKLERRAEREQLPIIYQETRIRKN